MLSPNNQPQSERIDCDERPYAWSISSFEKIEMICRVEHIGRFREDHLPTGLL